MASGIEKEKFTSAAKANRQKEITELIGTGMSFSRIISYICTTWNVAESTVRNDLTELGAIYRKSLEDREELSMQLGVVIQRLIKRSEVLDSDGVKAARIVVGLFERQLDRKFRDQEFQQKAELRHYQIETEKARATIMARTAESESTFGDLLVSVASIAGAPTAADLAALGASQAEVSRVLESSTTATVRH